MIIILLLDPCTLFTGIGKPPFMRNPHLYSAKLAIDPAYSSERITPDPIRYSLFSTHSTQTNWLYNFGDLEAFLMMRMRQESFSTCCNVYHPGRFRSFASTLYCRKMLHLNHTGKKERKAEFRFSGNYLVTINGRLCLQGTCTDPKEITALHLGEFLVKGTNKIDLRVSRIDQPPCCTMHSSFCNTDSSWQCSNDMVQWIAPGLFSFVNNGNYPHSENLPAVTLKSSRIQPSIFDFGKQVFGKPVFSLTKKQPVQFLTGESIPEAVNDNPAHFEQYIEQPSAPALEHRSQNEYALRYIRVKTPGNDAVRKVELEAPCYPVQYKGAFACSDETLTRIWMHSAYTLRMCMHELFIDGPKRDRLPWVGDVFMGSLCNYFSFADSNIVKHSLLALYGDDPEEIDFNGIITYSFFWIISLKDYIMFTDDIIFLDSVYTRFLRLMKALSDKEDSIGLLPSAPMKWIFIDWAPIDTNGYSSCLNMLYIIVLDAAAGIASLKKDAQRSETFAKKARHLRKQCRSMFWDRNQSCMADNFNKGTTGPHISRHANFFALLSGTADKRQEKMIIRKLTSGTLEEVGTPYMKTFEAWALSQHGLQEKMLSCINEYWGGMINSGASTFWEGYDKNLDAVGQLAFYKRPFAKSLCHAWSAGPLWLLSKQLLNLTIVEPGFRRFTIKPAETGLSWLTLHIPSPSGIIKIEIEGNHCRAILPPNVVMTVECKTGARKELRNSCTCSL